MYSLNDNTQFPTVRFRSLSRVYMYRYDDSYEYFKKIVFKDIVEYV